MLKPSDKLIDAFNQQIGNEMAASMHYIAVANYFTEETLPELAKFFYEQADEERVHALKFVRFLLDVAAHPEIPDIRAPKSRYASAEEAVELSLANEERVTEQISDLVELARAEKSLAAQRFLDWFVVEQQEEESTMTDLLAIIRRAGNTGLLHVEDYLARKGGSISRGGGEASAT
jgi:bacterioferritin B